VAWPTAEVLAAAENGDTVKLGTVAKTIPSPDGTFVLRIDPKAPIAEFMGPDGAVNFDIVHSSPGRQTMVAITRWFKGGATSGSWHATPDESTTNDLAVSLTDAATIEVGPVEAQEPIEKACGTAVLATWNNRIVTVGEVYTGPNATGDFEYINGASSTLGVGYSVSGSYGSFSASGTNAMSSTFTENYPAQAQNRRTVMQTEFGYRKYRTACHNGTFWYNVRPYQFQGGQTMYTAASSPTANNCVSYVKGGSTTKDTGTAITFTNGAHLAGVIGIDLSSKTGFTANTKIKFTWVNAGRLCGTNAFPPQAARVVGK
jgi:hypothetical protein